MDEQSVTLMCLHYTLHFILPHKFYFTHAGSPSTVNSLEDTLHTCSTILSVLAAVCFVVLFPVGAVIGALVTYFTKLKSQRKTKAEIAEPYYDYISHSDRIETDTNMSYTKTAPPPVAMNTLITKTE